MNHELLTSIRRFGATASGSILTVAPEARLHAAGELVDAGAFIHADVLDDSFPMKHGVSAELLAALSERWADRLDVHVMAENSTAATTLPLGRTIARLTVHVHEGEAGGIRDLLGDAADQLWLSIDPRTWSSADAVSTLIDEERPDGILMMLTSPGVPDLSADAMIMRSTPWRAARERVPLGVDGGVRADLLASIVDAGADYVVVGRSLFPQPSRSHPLREDKP